METSKFIPMHGDVHRGGYYPLTAIHDNLPRANRALAKLRSALTEGRLDEAVAIAQEAVGAAPHYAAAIAGLATALKRAGRDAEARSVLTEAPSDVLGSTGDRLDMAAVCLREGVSEPAMEILRMTLEANQRDDRAAELLARAYLTQNNFAAVVAVCGPFHARGKATPTLLRLLAAAYERLSDLQSAEDCAHMYSEAAPLDPRGHYHLATLEHRLGNVAEAMDRYDLAIELGGADPKLATAASDGIRALDALQLRQITAQAGRDPGFRIALQRDITGTLDELGFVLSEEGVALLASMDLDSLAATDPGATRQH